MGHGHTGERLGLRVSDMLSTETGGDHGGAWHLGQPAHPAAPGREEPGAEAGGEEEGLLGGVSGGEGEAGEGSPLDSANQGLQGATEGSIPGDLIF